MNLVGNSVCLKQLFVTLASELGHFPNLVQHVVGKIHWHKDGVVMRWDLAPKEWDEVGSCFLIQLQVHCSSKATGWIKMK